MEEYEDKVEKKEKEKIPKGQNTAYSIWNEKLFNNLERASQNLNNVLSRFNVKGKVAIGGKPGESLSINLNIEADRDQLIKSFKKR